MEGREAFQRRPTEYNPGAVDNQYRRWECGGGIGDLLKGGLGGLLAGGAAGSVLSGGLSDLLRQFQQNGQGEAANSWVSNGPNKEMAPDDLGRALGADQLRRFPPRAGCRGTTC